MPRVPFPRLLWSALLVTPAIAFSGVARAEPSKAECAGAYEKSQEQRASGKLTGAHEQLAICANDACPAFVRTDCVQWLGEVEREIPTVSFEVKDDKGADATAVKVTMDGSELLSELDGKSVQVDPGTHQFEFSIDGADPIKKEIEIRKGEKDRVISVSFGKGEEPKDDDPYGASHAAAKDEPKPDEESAGAGPGPLRPYAYVAGGVGAAGIIGFVVLGAMGKSQQSDLESSCGPTRTCSKDDVSAAKTKLVLADVSLGVGIAGLGAGVALFFLSQPKSGDAAEEEKETAHFDLVPRRDGAFATYSGRF